MSSMFNFPDEECLSPGSATFVWSLRVGDRVDVIYNRSLMKCAIGKVYDKIYPNILKIQYYNRFSEEMNITVDISELPSFVNLKKLNTVTPFHRYLTDNTVPQCINVDKKQMAKCKLCRRTCCIICSLFQCKWDRYHEYQCASCTKQVEYNRIFKCLTELQIIKLYHILIKCD